MTGAKIKIITTPRLKRAFDLVLASALLLLVSPLLILILAAIFLEHVMRGEFFAPLFYVEKRMSRGRPFSFVKFNVFDPQVIAAMRKSGRFIHTKDLEHAPGGLICAGRVVQRMYLDELPQLVNVLAGNMSIVGPRPVNTEVHAKMMAQEAGNAVVLTRPGITGPYQIHKGEPGVSQDRVDRAYIDFCAIHSGWRVVLMDLKIIWKTLPVILRAGGL